MSTQYPGGFITKSPVAPTTSAASGIWTVDQALQYVKAGTWPSPPSPYIEDWFSTYLYTGNNAAQAISNGINLSAYGGLVWTKGRQDGSLYHVLTDSVTGPNNYLRSNSAGTATTYTANGWSVPVFNANGYTTSNSGYVSQSNANLNQFVSWTFAKRAKFFDIVTYSGTGSNTTISHNLGTVPGCIFVKRLNAGGSWQVYHRSLANTQYLVLDDIAAAATGATRWNSTTPTASVFSLGTDATVNAAGGTYVAYLFAHDAGGFGLTGTDNVISCGSYTTDSSANATVTLGYEPQFILMKQSSTTGDWQLIDNMRGISVGSQTKALLANSTAAEANSGTIINLTATGFKQDASGSASTTYIYIAIRRGPMKTPTVGTSVLGITSRSGTAANATVTGLNAVDFMLTKMTSGVASGPWANRLTADNYMSPTASDAQTTNATSYQTNPWDVQNGVKVGTGSAGSLTNLSGGTYINYLFNRAPSFFDIVCYTGTGVATTITHNLGTTPLFYIVKCRSNSAGWYAYSQTTGATYYINASNDAAAANDINFWNNTAPTSSVFSVNTEVSVNGSARTYIAYLFATCPGVSKVGSYTGTAALQTIDCGFTTGARFVMIKRTNGAGDWYVYDSTRGLSSGTDPYFLWTQPNAEVTGTNYVDTDTTGFKVTAAAPAGLNAVGGNYIFLAIA